MTLGKSGDILYLDECLGKPFIVRAHQKTVEVEIPGFGPNMGPDTEK